MAPRNDHLAAVFTGARPHIHDPVSRADRFLVVLDHQHGVAQIPHTLQRVYEPYIVSLMQANTRLIQNVENTHQLAADLRSQPDPLRLAPRQRNGSAVKRQIVESHVHHELQPRLDLFQYLAANGKLAR